MPASVPKCPLQCADTVKVRMQLYPPSVYPSSIHCFQRTLVEEGVVALWRGSVPALTGAITENCIAFALNAQLKRFIREEDFSVYSRPLITGGITGFITSLALCPSDVVKCRAQAVRGSEGNVSIFKIVANILKSRGVPGLFQGVSLQVMRDTPFYAAMFGSYDVICHLMKKYTSVQEHVVYFVAGGVAGQVAWATTMPLDVIKSIVQTSDDKNVTTTSVAKDIYRRQGVRGLFRGLTTAVVRAFPANAALFVTYEAVKKLFS